MCGSLTLLYPILFPINTLTEKLKRRRWFLLWGHFVQSSKQMLFDFEVFHNSLHHKIGVLNYRCSICAYRDILQDFLNECFSILESESQLSFNDLMNSTISHEINSFGTLVYFGAVKLTSGFSANFFFATLFRLASIPFVDFFSMSSDVSTNTTECPVDAATWNIKSMMQLLTSPHRVQLLWCRRRKFEMHSGFSLIGNTEN